MSANARLLKQNMHQSPPNLSLKTKILIVDDDISLLKTIDEILTNEGYLTDSAQTGKEAIEKCQREYFDVGLIDLKLPDIEGTRLLQVLKTISPNMVKIIITGYPSLGSAVNSLNLGAEEYLIKPFDPDRLLDLIKGQTERHRLDKWENLFATIGLSPNESKVYLTLAMNGTLEIRKISMASGVPRTKTYAAVHKLVQRGLVSESPGPIQKYAITSPANAFDPILRNWKKDLSEQSKILVEFEETLKQLESISTEKLSTPQSGVEKETVWTISGSQEIDQRINEMLSEAQRSVRILANEDGLVRFYRPFAKKLDQLVAKKVKVQFHIQVDEVNKTLLNDLKFAYKVVNVHEAGVPYLLLDVDKNKILVAESSAEKETAILADSEKLTLFFKGLFKFEQCKKVGQNPSLKENRSHQQSGQHQKDQ